MLQFPNVVIDSSFLFTSSSFSSGDTSLIKPGPSISPYEAAASLQKAIITVSSIAGGQGTLAATPTLLPVAVIPVLSLKVQCCSLASPLPDLSLQ